MSAARLFATFALALLFAGTLSAQEGDAESERYAYVRMTTSLGTLTIELDREKAPATVANFLTYVHDGFYDGTIFHRVIADFMAQGGGFTPGLVPKPPTHPAVRNESDNGLTNDVGTLSMARTGDPHSATSQFFLNFQKNDFLNHQGGADGWGYAVFGKVIDGFDVMLAMRQARVEYNPQADRNAPAYPIEPIIILKAEEISAAQCGGAIAAAREAEANPPADLHVREEVTAALGTHADPVKALVAALGHDPEGVRYAPSGLGTLMLENGSGEAANADSVVQVHYTGWLLDGQAFDSSRERGEPATFPLNGVIKAWTEGVSQMREGDRMLLVAPPEMAYGARGAGNVIPPDATLVFDVQLLAVKDYSSVDKGKELLAEKGVDVSAGQTTASGLFYVDTVVGDGATPTRSDKVSAHYSGWLNDGQGFDSSLERGTPIDFAVTGVIRGWTEALLSMKVGGTRFVVIPYELAYGAQGRPPQIPPKAALVFEMRLLGIK